MPTSKATKKPTPLQVVFAENPQASNAVRKLANEERRSYSLMGEILITEALQARGLLPKDSQ